MTLDEYMAVKKLKTAEMAEATGLSEQTIYKYRRGERKPGDDETMLRIFKATKGAVTANDFFNLPAGSRSNRSA